MAIGETYRPVQRPDYYKPIADEVILLGAKQQYETAEKVGQLVGLANQKMFGIQTYGKDAEVLSQLHNNFQKEIDQLSQGSFSDPANISKINTVIGRYTNDPDLMAVSKRINLYNSELKRQQEAEEKGEPFTSPIIETLNTYYSGSNYYRNPKDVNLSRGWTSPPLQKWMKESREAVKKRILDTKTGEVKEVVDPTEARDYFMQLASSDPRFLKQLQWDYQKATKNLDWNTEGQKYISEKIEEKRAAINQAKIYGDAEAELLATKELIRLQKMADPKLVGDELNNQYFNSWFNNEMDKIGYSMDVTSFVDYKRDPVYMENLKTKNNITEAYMKEYIQAGVDPYTGKQIMVAGKPLAEIKKQQEKEKTYKPSEKEVRGERILKQGVINQAEINELLDPHEVATLKSDGKGGLFIEYYRKEPIIDPKTNDVVYSETPKETFPVDEFLVAKTNRAEFRGKVYKVGSSTQTPTQQGSMANQMP